MSHYPIVAETICGILVGAFGRLAVRRPLGQICVLLFLLVLVVVRIAMCGTAAMSDVLNHLLGDLSQILYWVIAHQSLTLGFTIGTAMMSAIRTK